MPQHTPPHAGRKPLAIIWERLPSCPDPAHQCSWGFHVGRWLFQLKFINGGCYLHRLLPASRGTAGPSWAGDPA
jgi:hypothetical protein